MKRLILSRYFGLFWTQNFMLFSLCRILIVDTRVEFGSNKMVLTTRLLIVYSSALWTRNSTRMIFDEPSIFGCVDLMVYFFNTRIRQIVCSSALWM
ncbi:hypothetical protein RclHR1_01140001 [Rhizophagus clarus]|uniref:Uncharacterized protein n=1 Tax=Rhizophagus clarus TaxID=94130 RepID=A0A2Z6Q8M1_9GLOM|nr:hypothetical protein RclHR1_01140001 [Rhizophagus clarus]